MKKTTNPPSSPHTCNRWVYCIKGKSDGSIDRLKAHLVAQGYNQSEGVNFTYAYSPIVKPATVRCVNGIIVARGWSLHQLNIRNVLLNGNINGTVYMQ